MSLSQPLFCVTFVLWKIILLPFGVSSFRLKIWMETV